MSLEPPSPAADRSPEDYGLDELVRHQKRQTGLVALILLGAVLFTAGRGLLPGSGPPEPPEPGREGDGVGGVESSR